MSPWTVGPAAANNRSPSVTRYDGRTSSRLVDDGRRRLRDGMSATWRGKSDRRRPAVKSSVDEIASLNWIRSGALKLCLWPVVHVSFWQRVTRPFPLIFYVGQPLHCRNWAACFHPITNGVHRFYLILYDTPLIRLRHMALLCFWFDFDLIKSCSSVQADCALL